MNINITILGQAISFVIFVVFCVKYVWVPIISVIEKRQKIIADTFSDAENLKKMSKIERDEANDCLNRAKSEAELIIKRANQYRIELIDEAKCEAKIEKNKILFQARQTISLEKKRIFEELHKEASLMILSGVEKIVESSMNKYIDHHVVNKIICELQDNNKKELSFENR